MEPIASPAEGITPNVRKLRIYAAMGTRREPAEALMLPISFRALNQRI